MNCLRQTHRRLIQSNRALALLPPIETCRLAIPALSSHAKLTPKTSIAHGSSSSTRWKTRQTHDHFAREAKVAGLKSRAAFKLLELDSKHHIFRKGGTVVDLGYAPGSWSQVAVSRTSPGGRVLGIDIIPAQPPRGASSIQGNFLSAEVQAEVRRYVRDPALGRARARVTMSKRGEGEEEDGPTEEEVEGESRGVLRMTQETKTTGTEQPGPQEEEGEHQQQSDHEAEKDEEAQLSVRKKDLRDGRVVDVVLSDMSAPWEQTTGHWIRSVSNPYFRMMNTSGTPFRDHAGSMDLCNAALTFCYDTLRTGGHFMCKFYQGAEDKAFENRLKKLFDKVHKEKPESSRKESKEAYFVALRRKPDVQRELVFPDEYVEDSEFPE
ncbi:FtsJ-domain-containing protein [Aureobasidium subglaciale]|nr:FtsJ-domain-containing protein [Aureobasidium subglaciale]KAI5268555.1 FtsJ-domain-containing protein [Aureobasidium subglaciale]